MELTSLHFIFFYIIVLLMYYLVPKRLQWIHLLLSSAIFYYLSNNWKLCLLFLYTIVITFGGAIWIENEERKKNRKYKFIIIVILILLTLFGLKYINFLLYTGNGIGRLFGIRIGDKIFHVLAPLGISFYTLNLLGYVIDIFWKTEKAQKNFLKHALYAIYFPITVSGPIIRYKEMKKQLFEYHPFSYENLTFGLQRIAWGFFKKLVISERVAMVVNQIFENYYDYKGIFVFLGSICFAVQLYTDFSGCMDIVIGISESLGIFLPENFITPFSSRNLSEFWRRWHITLGSWFKDYIFYPLLKSDFFQLLRKSIKKRIGKKWSKKLPTYIGLFILWFLIGLWHGGSWNFIIGSGLLQWFYIVTGELLEPTNNKIISLFKINTNCYSFKLFQQARTTALLCIGFIFFRSTSMMAAIKMLYYSIIHFFNGNITFVSELSFFDIVISIVCILALFMVSVLQNKFGTNQVRKKLSKQNILIRWGIFYILIFTIIIFGIYGTEYDSSGFIYQQF